MARVVNFLDVADLIDFVADDTPQKQGKYLSGARPNPTSSELLKRGIKLCLLAISVNSEDIVLRKILLILNQAELLLCSSLKHEINL